MRRTQDYLHAYRGISNGVGRCRVCVYEEEGREPVVVVTALRSDPDVSISSVAPYLAAEVIARHFPDRLQNDLPVRWFEHYERSGWELKRLLPEFFQVEFSSYIPHADDVFGMKRLRIGTPQWTRIPREVIEDLIEQPLD